MPNTDPDPPRKKASNTGFGVACTLNILAIGSVLATILISRHEHDDAPLFVLAFLSQMETLGVIALCISLGDIFVNMRREHRMGMRRAIAGVVLSLTPQLAGKLVLGIAGHFLGWHLG